MPFNWEGCGFKLDYSIFTNLAQDHMDFHKDRGRVLPDKEEVVYQTVKMGIINIDDDSTAALKELREENTPARLFQDSQADYYGEMLMGRGFTALFCIKGEI